jgi:hypothetical protein
VLIVLFSPFKREKRPHKRRLLSRAVIGESLVGHIKPEKDHGNYSDSSEMGERAM